MQEMTQPVSLIRAYGLVCVDKIVDYDLGRSRYRYEAIPIMAKVLGSIYRKVVTLSLSKVGQSSESGMLLSESVKSML